MITEQELHREEVINVSDEMEVQPTDRDRERDERVERINREPFDGDGGKFTWSSGDLHWVDEDEDGDAEE